MGILDVSIDPRWSYEPRPAPSDRFELVAWDVSEYRGRLARPVLVDNSTSPGGHLKADEFYQ